MWREPARRWLWRVRCPSRDHDRDALGRFGKKGEAAARLSRRGTCRRTPRRTRKGPEKFASPQRPSTFRGPSAYGRSSSGPCVLRRASTELLAQWRGRPGAALARKFSQRRSSVAAPGRARARREGTPGRFANWILPSQPGHLQGFYVMVETPAGLPSEVAKRGLCGPGVLLSPSSLRSSRLSLRRRMSYARLRMRSPELESSNGRRYAKPTAGELPTRC